MYAADRKKGEARTMEIIKDIIKEPGMIQK